MWPNPQFPADLVTFTKEILNGKLHFSCSGTCSVYLLLTFQQVSWKSFWTEKFWFPLLTLNKQMPIGCQYFLENSLHVHFWIKWQLIYLLVIFNKRFYIFVFRSRRFNNLWKRKAIWSLCYTLWFRILVGMYTYQRLDLCSDYRQHYY